MGITPNFAATPTVGAALLTTGDTSRTAPTTTGTIFAPGAGGGTVERIVIQPVATTVASVIRFFRYDGTNYHLYTEVTLDAQTLSGGIVAAQRTLQAVDNPGIFPICIPANWSLRVTVNDTQTGVKVQAEGGAF